MDHRAESGHGCTSPLPQPGTTAKSHQLGCSAISLPQNHTKRDQSAFKEERKNELLARCTGCTQGQDIPLLPKPKPASQMAESRFVPDVPPPCPALPGSGRAARICATGVVLTQRKICPLIFVSKYTCNMTDIPNTHNFPLMHFRL